MSENMQELVFTFLARGVQPSKALSSDKIDELVSIIDSNYDLFEKLVKKFFPTASKSHRPKFVTVERPTLETVLATAKNLPGTINHWIT